MPHARRRHPFRSFDRLSILYTFGFERRGQVQGRSVDYEKLKSGVIPLLAVMQGGEYAAPKPGLPGSNVVDLMCR